MISLMPSLFIDSPPVSPGCVQVPRPEDSPVSPHLHISSFRSLLLDMQIYSPFVKSVNHPGVEASPPCPVFCDRDKVGGKVTLDPRCSQNGRLTISLEGTFEYSSLQDNLDDEYPLNPTIRKHRHAFMFASATIPMTPVSDSRTTIREALSVRKRPSTTSLKSPQAVFRSCEFSFELPPGSRFGEEMPPTFSSKTPPRDLQGQLRTGEFEVTYRVTAVWEESDTPRPKSILEAPILFQPETDFQSLDGSVIEPEFWTEMPLSPERIIPFNCAVTLPSPQSFSRCSFVPYFVVFTTNDRLPCLIKEIAADATITVTLVRNITLTSRRTPQSLVLPDTPPTSDDSDGQTSFTPYFKPTKRLVKSTSRSHIRGNSSPNQHLHQPPQIVLSVSQILETQLFIGFPKRPRANGAPESLPDGLCKGNMRLSRDMLPSMDWPGISVKYHLDVSVLVGQDDVRARIPIKIY